jgi:predicted ester cyclase
MQVIPEINKSIVLRFYEEVANANKLDVADEVFVDNYVDHDPPSPSEVWPRGSAGARASLEAYRAAFPDMRFSVEQVLAEGDDVAVRYVFSGTHRGTFLGIDATGTPIRFTGISLFRIVGDRIAESWAQFDLLDFIQQVGTWPQQDRATPDTPAELGPIV